MFVFIASIRRPIAAWEALICVVGLCVQLIYNAYVLSLIKFDSTTISRRMVLRIVAFDDEAVQFTRNI